jgi:uncharacterized protein (TIGR02231 family)
VVQLEEKGAKKKYRSQKQEAQGQIQQMPARSTDRSAETVGGVTARASSSAPKGAVHTRFSIESEYDIPSDRQGRSVTIKELKIDAEHDHLAIPKLEEKAFLIAKLSGWEATDLFPGEASVQYAGRYVGKTRIDPNITDDTLEVSLGRDQGVVVDRKKVRDKTSEQVIGGKKVLEMGIDIELKNKRDKAVSLRVKDQIPLSGSGDVEVNLKERSGAEYDEGTGELIWKLELGPGKSKTLNFAFTIKYPKELDPVGL